MIDQARRSKESVLKEALHIQLTPSEDRFNRDVGIELPDCWIVTLKMLRGGAGARRPVSSGHVHP